MLIFSHQPRCTECPKPAVVEIYGCSANRITEPDGTNRWHVRTWANLKDHTRWSRLHSIREDNELKKALKDCNQFLKCAKKQK